MQIDQYRERIAAGRWVRVPHRWWIELARELTYVELCCAAVILTETHGKSRSSAPIPFPQFLRTSNASRRAVESALDRLSQEGYVDIRHVGKPGQMVKYYAIASDWLPREAGPVATGRCDHCGAVAEIERSPRGEVYLPHEFLLDLPAKLERGEYLVLGLIWDRTLGWNQAEAAVSVEYLQQATGLSRRRVQTSLQVLRERALITAERHAGKVTVYAPVLSWVHLEARAPRKVSRNQDDAAGGAVECQPPAPRTPKPAAPEPEAEDAAKPETWHREVGRCRSCGAVGVCTIFDEIPAAEHLGGASRRPGSRPPGPERSAGTPPGQVDPRVYEVKRYLAEVWGLLVQYAPDDVVCGRIVAALDQAPVADLARRAEARREYLRRNARSWEVFVRLADDVRKLRAAEAAQKPVAPVRPPEVQAKIEDAEAELLDPSSAHLAAWILEEFPVLINFAAGVRARRDGAALKDCPAGSAAAKAEWRRGWEAAG